MTIKQAKDEAWKRDLNWLAMDASGELWAGEIKPEYHEIFGIWIWSLCEQPVKIGWVYPVKDWRSARWHVMQ